MNNFIPIAHGLDVIPLLLALKRKPELWKEDTYLRDYPQGPFGCVETVFLRFPPVSATELERDGRDQHESINRDEFKHLPQARDMIFWLMNRVQGERLGRVMINRIKPGGLIYPHADTPAHANYYDRFHICLESNNNSYFRCGDESVNMKPGEVWWFQNKLEHEVKNEGDCDRTHMIVDIRTHYHTVDK